jgi:tRNA pseudouridine13 synthase
MMRAMRIAGVTVKKTPEDFEVREVASVTDLCPRSQGSHTYLSITKRGVSTFDAARRIADALALDVTSVNWLGLKDEDGVTTQLLSVAATLSDDDADTLSARLAEQPGPGWITVDGIIGHGRDHVSRHALIGNSFRVVLRGLDTDRLGYLAGLGDGIVVFPNYYDSQRFGVVGSGITNTHVIGEHLRAGDGAAAYREFLVSGASVARKEELTSAFERLGDHHRAFAAINRREVRFLLDSAASFRWNAALSEALARSGPAHLVPGLNEVQDLNICPEMVDRPVPPMLAIPSVDIDNDGKGEGLDGLRLRPTDHRRLSTQPTRLRVQSVSDTDDGELAAAVEFFLPRGSYATMLLKYLLWCHAAVHSVG